MAIGRNEVFAAADALNLPGKPPTVDAVQQRLKKKHRSGGNRNKVSKELNEWFEERGIPRKSPRASKKVIKKTVVSKTATVSDTPRLEDVHPSILDKLPTPVKQSVIALITAIVTIIGLVRSQERTAATEIADHRNLKLQEDLDEERGKNKLLSIENAELREQLAQKSSSAADKLLGAMTEFMETRASHQSHEASQKRSRSTSA